MPREGNMKLIKESVVLLDSAVIQNFKDCSYSWWKEFTCIFNVQHSVVMLLLYKQ